MVSIIKRMAKLKAQVDSPPRLLAIRIGPGAAILPPEVTKIQMEFAIKMNDGHMGPRKFWRGCLPRLKFHNPAVPMTINRTTNQDGPATMTVHFTSPSSSSSTENSQKLPPPTKSEASYLPSDAKASASPGERIEIIDMKYRSDSQILQELMLLTKAKEVEPTEVDLQELAEVEEARAKSEMDSERSLRDRQRVKREAAMMAQARGAVADAQNA